MTTPDPAPEPVVEPKPAAVDEAKELAAGDWKRLHPLTPLLRGGIAFVAILGVVIVNLRDILIENVFGGGSDEYDPLTYINEHGYLLPIVGAIIGGLLLFIAGFYLSWRMHTFRITDELVEVRSGILMRTHRRGRLDRIQGVNVSRPFLARLVGTAKIEITVAGQDANVPLAFLGSAAADALRLEILRLASGTRRAAQQQGQPQTEPGVGLVEQRLNELVAPELDPDAAPPESVVKIPPGRLIASLVVNDATLWMLAVIAGLVALLVATGEPAVLFGVLPALLGFGSFYVSRFTKTLRYSIAQTQDGVRVGYGLLSTANETLPPGRIHALQVQQPLLWRPFGWWEIKINRATAVTMSNAQSQAMSILPVGTIADVRRVLELVLPGLLDEESVQRVERAITSAGAAKGSADGEPDADGFMNSPKRARMFRWFSRRRNGVSIVPGAVLLRRGQIWRDLIVVPAARVQSVDLRQGPLWRSRRLAGVRVHTVAGPVQTHIGALDAEFAVDLHGRVAAASIESAVTDTSHRWRSQEAAE